VSRGRRSDTDVGLMSGEQTARGDLGALLRMLRRRFLLILLAPIVALGVAYVVAKQQQKQYTATAVLLFKPLLLDVQLTGLPLQVQSSDPTTEAATDIGLVTLPQVRNRAARLLRNAYTADYLKNNVSVAQQGKSQLVDVKGSAPTPIAAAAVSNAMATAFIGYERQNLVSSINDAIANVQKDLNAGGNTPLQKAVLRNNVTKLTELKAVQPDNVALAGTALPPTSPSSPKTTLDLVIGGIAGLLVGIALALIAEQLDSRVRRAEEVEDALNLPVLATIPRSRVMKRGEPLSPADLEAFRLLRTNLRYRSGGRDIRSVLLTSAGSGSGKTTVALHLAATAAAVVGGRVLLIEADLRRPRLSNLLGLPEEHGLSTALAESTPLEAAVVTVPGSQRSNGAGPDGDGDLPGSFDVLTAGPPTAHASELLSTRQMGELLRTASEGYDLTIVDGPPPGLVSDVIPLIKQVDAVVLVARLGRENSPELKRLRAQLRDLGVEPVGVVANFSRATANPYTASSRH
jgi:Mrp family chromosome partitioning ATPase/LPS O-antigen subunit length determinant protein (WzzB/FepE family)